MEAIFLTLICFSVAVSSLVAGWLLCDLRARRDSEDRMIEINRSWATSVEQVNKVYGDFMRMHSEVETKLHEIKLATSPSSLGSIVRPSFRAGNIPPPPKPKK